MTRDSGLRKPWAQEWLLHTLFALKYHSVELAWLAYTDYLTFAINYGPFYFRIKSVVTLPHLAPIMSEK